jgi:hydroxymethylbilane synthase
VFASALQEALLDRTVDLAVHCTKDLPTISPVGIGIAAYTQREDARDVVVSRHGTGLEGLPANPVIGTSSRRRAVQVLALRPDAVITELRGNIDTRLRKAESGDYDAIILAAAGLTRMGWADRVTAYLSFDQFVPAPGQGALAVETRIAPDPVWELTSVLNDPAVGLASELERSYLRAMGGGCTTPVGAHAVIDGEQVQFWAMMASDDGLRLARQQVTIPLATARDEVPCLSRRMMRDLTPVWVGAGLPPSKAEGVGALHDKLVVVTGTGDFVERTSGAFAARGADVLPASTVQIHPSSTPGVLGAALRDAAAGGFDWLVVTSTKTVDLLDAFGGEHFVGKAKIAVVGQATAAAMQAIGIPVDLVPAEQTGPGLAQELVEAVPAGSKVLCLLGSRAGDTITSPLRRADVHVVRVESYRSVATLGNGSDVRAQVRGGRVDVLVFASPSSAQVMAGSLGADLAALSGACLVAIGSTTAAAMKDLGLPVHVVAKEPSPEGVVAACETYFAGR